MSNYTNLKAAIADVIKQNGNQEITGNLLQQVLLNIVSAVGANSAFVGIATPSTVPGSPDGNEFYIAFEPGLYADFGGYTLTNNLTIFINKSGSWVALPTIYNKAYIDTELGKKVSKTGSETIQGVKTFESSPLVPTPESEDAAAPKEYVDNQDATKVSKTGNETINGVKTFQSSPIVPAPTQSTEVATKGYVDSGLALKVNRAEVDYIRYSDRVALDSGTIRDKVMLKAMYDDALNLLPNTVLAYSPEMGVKQSVSGLVYKASKLYDMSPFNNDANQATAGLRPYIGGNIAPNEKLWLWGASKSITFSPISFNTTAKWSVSLVLRAWNNTVILGGSSTALSIVGGSFIRLTTSSGAQTTKGITTNTTIRLLLVALGDGTLQVWQNGVLLETISVPTNVTFSNIFGENPTVNGKIYSLRIFNKELSKSEIEGLDKFLASIYPEHETTNIGSQAWLTSNHIGNVTSDGFIIPEVQGNDAASNPELLSGGNFESGLVGTLLNETGGAAVTYTLNTINPISGTQDGRLQVTSVGTADIRPIIQLSTMAVGKTFRVTFDYKVNSGTPIISKLANGENIWNINKTLSGTGSYTIYLYRKTTATFFLYFDGRNLFDLQIDNISIKEVGWADSQAIYDYYISIGQSVLEATKAAAMWCKYNNSDDNAAVYGYLYNWWAVYLFSLYPPKGLRVPTKADFDQLVETLGGATVAGGKLKASGLTYWMSPNMGATNESGFTALEGGYRTDYGTFNVAGFREWTATSGANPTNGAMLMLQRSNTAVYIADSTEKKVRGYSLRFLKNAPSGLSEQELDTGLFTTDIATAQKELTMSFGHKVTEIKVNSLTNNLTNFKVELRSSAGVLLTTLVQNVSITANSPIDIPILVTQPMLFQDAKLWITATGNTGVTNLGMQVKILTRQNMY